MAKQATVTNLLMVALIAVILGGAYMLMGAKTPLNTTGQGTGGSGATSGGDSIVSGAGVGYATTVSVATVDAITKNGVQSARGYLYTTDNKIVGAASDVALTSATTTLTSTSPNSVDGFAMIGNDNGQGTDGGAEIYFKRVPVKFSGTGSYSIADAGIPNVEIYNESTSITWTAYEENTVESSLNVTVGTSPVKTVKLKFAPVAGTALGNPQLSNPLGVCFNVTTDSNWNDITPYGVKYNKIATPEAYKGYNIIGCYEFTDTDALADDSGVHNSEYTFGVNLDPAANPANEALAAYLMDKTYFKDDAGVWQIGFADDSTKGTDTDPGIDGFANVVLYTAY